MDTRRKSIVLRMPRSLFEHVFVLLREELSAEGACRSLRLCLQRTTLDRQTLYTALAPEVANPATSTEHTFLRCQLVQSLERVPVLYREFRKEVKRDRSPRDEALLLIGDGGSAADGFLDLLVVGKTLGTRVSPPSVHLRRGSCVELPGPGFRRISLYTGSRNEPGEGHKDGHQPLRTISVLGEDACAALKNLRVAVVGVSRTGSLTAERLAHTYCARNLLLVDPDRFEQQNLAEASALLSDEHVGRNKAEAMASVLHRRYGTTAQAREEALTLSNKELIREIAACDLVITTTDTVLSRYIAGWVASLYHLAHLDIGVRIGASNASARRAVDTRVDARLFFPGYHNECIYCRDGLHTGNGRFRLEMAARNTQPVGSLTSLNHVAVGIGLRLLEEAAAETLDGTSHVGIEGYTSETAGTDTIRIDPPEACFCRFAGEGDQRLSYFEDFRSVVAIDADS